ncbi:MAG TPA: zf-HC2 domain-containing protein [Longimicrobiales bacterium]
MNHVSEGMLQSFLDGELDREARTRVEHHVDACGACAAVLSELRDAAIRLEHALALLDRPAPLEAAERAMRRRRVATRVAAPRRALARAAVMILGFAAVGSAAIPDSPIRAWVAAAWRQGVAVFADAPAEPAPATPAAETGAGISIRPHDGSAWIVVESPAPGVRARVRLVDGDRVAVRALGAAASARFRTGPGRVDIVAPGAGELEIDVPASLAGARLEVDGRVVVTKVGATLDVLGGVVAERSPTEVVVDLTGSNRAR